MTTLYRVAATGDADHKDYVELEDERGRAKTYTTENSNWAEEMRAVSQARYDRWRTQYMQHHTWVPPVLTFTVESYPLS